MQKAFIQVQEPATSKTTSSWLKKIIGAGVKFLVGIDLFKSAWNNAPDPQSGLAIATNQTPSQLDAQLRLTGIDPTSYYDHVSALLGTDVTGKSEVEINTMLAEAQDKAKDPGQLNWLYAAGGLLLILGLSNPGRRGISRAYSSGRKRYSNYRARRMARRRRR